MFLTRDFNLSKLHFVMESTEIIWLASNSRFKTYFKKRIELFFKNNYIVIVGIHNRAISSSSWPFTFANYVLLNYVFK